MDYFHFNLCLLKEIALFQYLTSNLRILDLWKSSCYLWYHSRVYGEFLTYHSVLTLQRMLYVATPSALIVHSTNVQQCPSSSVCWLASPHCKERISKWEAVWMCLPFMRWKCFTYSNNSQTQLFIQQQLNWKAHRTSKIILPRSFPENYQRGKIFLCGGRSIFPFQINLFFEGWFFGLQYLFT
jgi:hypothetical protein